ncbi:oocyte zinc finger protein XlCOF26-like [Chironomus tepperi]|uniref:oocyte zinc finger protein XlCOF26-like n=1 Tax=Chironomus tepperi TaxID=113505 RepID=UPI00391FB344
MTRKITNFFKIKPKIDKIDEEVLSVSKIRECQVILKDIKHQFGNNELRLFEEISINERNSSKLEKNNCKFCGKKFSSEGNLKHHMKNIHPTEFDLFNCKICNRRFFKKQSLEVHMKKKHPDGQIEKFECDFDGKIFKTKSLYNHQKSHNRLKSFQCQRCDYATNIKYNFKKHQNVHERQDKKFAAMKNPLKCEKCPSFYKNEMALSMHMRNVHPKELLQCDLCAKFIKNKNGLIIHMNNHIRKAVIIN